MTTSCACPTTRTSTMPSSSCAPAKSSTSSASAKACALPRTVWIRRISTSSTHRSISEQAEGERMLSLCFAVPNEDTNLTAVDLSISIHAPLAGCDMLRTNHLLAARCSILCRTCIFCVCRKHCRRRAVFATPCKDRHCMPYILSGSPLLCRCSTFGGSFPSHTNRLVCILWRFGSVFLMDVHRGPLWRSFAILPSRIVGFCGFALLFRSGFFSHISLLRFLFDPTMSFDSCFPAFRRM